ncbi:hypothetical protein KIPB_000329 [Kipferlia bialata]|uniref:Uncharacterized protein n=1 Tax=Kipferlia bialata TaxID=797122 RepID=A0A9K3CP27_9EUKA|nr:hypothetical protein KIPB_000329 [Kipferlia bialata]|eukprot:g329.t1
MGPPWYQSQTAGQAAGAPDYSRRRKLQNRQHVRRYGFQSSRAASCASSPYWLPGPVAAEPGIISRLQSTAGLYILEMRTIEPAGDLPSVLFSQSQMGSPSMSPSMDVSVSPIGSVYSLRLVPKHPDHPWGRWHHHLSLAI